MDQPSQGPSRTFSRHARTAESSWLGTISSTGIAAWHFSLPTMFIMGASRNDVQLEASFSRRLGRLIPSGSFKDGRPHQLSNQSSTSTDPKIHKLRSLSWSQTH